MAFWISRVRSMTVILGTCPNPSPRKASSHPTSINILLRFLAQLVYARHYAMDFTRFIAFNPYNHLCGGYYHSTGQKTDTQKSHITYPGSHG